MVRELAQNTFVGRSAELNELLTDLPDNNPGSQGHIKVLSGTAGSGKSRLLAELAKAAESQGLRVLWSERIEDPGAPPFFTWVLTIRSYLAYCDNSELVADLGLGASDLADLVPELHDYLELPAQSRPKDSISARFKMFDSVTRFLLASSKRTPLVILLDNLHLADRSSLELLEYFVQQISAYPILVIAAYRTLEADNHTDLSTTLSRLSLSPRFSQHSLEGLSLDDVAKLLSVHTRVSLPTALIKSVSQQSDGNPLFVVEVAKMLTKKPSDVPLPVAGYQFEIPNSLREVILTRLNTLSKNECKTLLCASVLGRNFDMHAMQALTGKDIGDTVISIHKAEEAGIVQLIKPGNYRFIHALFREVLYAQLKRQKRSRYHLAAAQYFEQRWGDPNTAVQAQLAYHYFEVAEFGFADKAVQFNRIAAESARKQRAYSESAICLERALLAYELKSDRCSDSQFDLLLGLGVVFFRAGQQEEAREPLLQAALLAKRSCNWLALADALTELQFVCGQLGNAHEYSLSLHHCLLQNLPAEEHALHTRALATLADAQRLHGDNDLAVKTATKSMEQARASGNHELQLECYCRGNWALGCSSANPESLPYRQSLTTEILAIAKEIGSSEERLHVMSSMCFNFGSDTACTALQAHLKSCRQLMDSEHHTHYLNILAGFEISINILQGDWAKAINHAMVLRQSAFVQNVAGLEGGFGQQMFVIQRALGQIAGTAALFKRIEADIDAAKLWLPGQILMHCELENLKRAKMLLSQVGGLSSLKQDGMFLASLIYLSEACIVLNDREWLINLYDALTPYRNIIANIPGTVMMGAVSGYLAAIAIHLDKKVKARELFEEAIDHNTRMSAAPWLARVQVDYAQLLLCSTNPKDQARAKKLIANTRRLASKFSLSPITSRLKNLARDFETGRLSKRETAVLQLISTGLSNKQIAAELSVSLSTVATHVRNILRKLQVKNRTEATTFARKFAMLEE